MSNSNFDSVLEDLLCTDSCLTDDDFDWGLVRDDDNPAFVFGSFFFVIKKVLGSWGVLFLVGTFAGPFCCEVDVCFWEESCEEVCLKVDAKKVGWDVVFLFGEKKLLDTWGLNFWDGKNAVFAYNDVVSSLLAVLWMGL